MADRYTKDLTHKQAKFVKNMVVHKMEQGAAAVAAGYSAKSADSQASQLLRNPKVHKALDKAGLNDEAVAKMIGTAVTSGLGVKSTNSDALRGLELVAKLRGYLSPEKEESNNQTNIYVNELRNLDINTLSQQLNELNISQD